MHYIEAIGDSFKRQLAILQQDNALIKAQPWLYRHQVQGSLKPIEPIKNIIAVASGKGGVGKSSIAFNLAYALSAAGLKVSVLDADIYGPSLPVLSGVYDKASLRPDKKFEPHRAFGMNVLSIGHLVDQQTALIWRGPMASGALMQLFNQTAWPPTDVMIVDLPPGTGDLLLTLCQKVPISGVVMVKNDHPLAHADVVRSEQLFAKLELPVLGHVVNQCQGKDHPESLMTFPHSRCIYEATAQGKPVSLYDPQGEDHDRFNLLAERVIDRLAERPIIKAVPLKVVR